MWLLFGAVALAGPPFQACATRADGTVAFVTPEGAVFTLAGDTATSVGRVAVSTSGRVAHAILPDPAGPGWLVGTAPTWRLVPGEAPTRVDRPEPADVWDALSKGVAAGVHGGDAVFTERGDDGGVVYRRNADASQVALWRFTGWSNAPLGLHDAGDVVFAIGHAGIEVRREAGEPEKLPLPTRTTLGLCAGGSAPLVAVGMGPDDQTCVWRRTGDAWTQVACVP